jgi:hypothetical protein
MAIVAAVPTVAAETEHLGSEPSFDAPGDDTVELTGDDLDQPDEPDSTEEPSDEEVEQSNHLFVPRINR